MSRPIKDRIGIRYGRLIVIEFAGREWDSYNNHILWLCKCNCGKKTIVRGGNLQSRNVKSCGCFQREKASEMCSKRIGKNHPNYTNGSRCGEATKIILKLKEKIRKRDNYICQECRMTQKQNLMKYNRILDVHHIDGDDTNNVEENMITLCLGCHLEKRKGNSK